MTAESTILEKIRALLAKADSTKFPTEAQAFTDKAAQLMARHNVEQAVLSGHTPGSDPVEDRTIELPQPYNRCKAQLLSQIAQAMSCHLVIRTPRDGSRAAHVFGHRSNLERVEFLYTSLLVQAMRLASLARPEHAGSRDGIKSFRRAWLLGFAVRVGQRLAGANADAVHEADQGQAAGAGAALVLAQRAQLAENALRAEYPTSRRARALSTRRRASADKADLGQRRVSGRRALGT